MPTLPDWTQAQDARLRRLWLEGRSWPDIACALGRPFDAVIERAATIAAAARTTVPTHAPEAADAEPPVEREPLPAGHPHSWGALVAGTLLDGTPYPLPVFDR